MVTFIINGKKVQGQEGWTILDAARFHGIEIPTLCHHEAMEPGETCGTCCLCAVEVEDGKRSRVEISCKYPIKNGIAVRTQTERVNVVRHRRLLELMDERPGWDKLQELAKAYGIPPSWNSWRAPWPSTYW
jgi:NADH dehydrogenase/NADH:ubiquinone oxidoreductase subunit G